METPKSIFRSKQTQLLYSILSSFQEPALAQEQQEKKEQQLKKKLKSKGKHKLEKQQAVSPIGRLKFLQINNWSIESQSKSPKHSSKSKYVPQTTRSNMTNAYFKSNNFTPRNKTHINIVDLDQTFDELNKSALTNKRKTNQSLTKSRLFTKSKLESIKKTIQFVPIQSKSKPYVFFNKNIAVLSKLLKQRYWLQPTNQMQKANFLWLNQRDFILFERIRIQQIKKQRQIQSSYLINHLSLDISKLLSQLSKSNSRYAPLTLQLGNNYKEFKKVVNIIQKEDRVKYWIIKPSKKANFCNSHICKTQLVKQFLQNLVKSKKHQSYQLIQEYIHDPFLYKKRKFIIKTYLLITNINKVTKAYLYNAFAIQTSSLEYKVDNRNLCIHFTGNEIQRQSKYYGKYEQNNRISQEELNQYLQDAAKDNIELNIEFRQSIRYACLQIVDSITSKTNNYYDHLNYQQLFQLSFIMQSNCNPVLIGIKNDPNLNIKYKEKQTQRLLQGVLKLSLDVLYPPPLAYLTRYQPGLEQFQLILDSRTQGIERLPHNIK